MSHILVIDDDPDIRSALKIFLSDAGYNVLDAPEGLSGIECASAHPPDAILLDVMMPEVDGFGVVSALQENPETADIPVIMLSAANDFDAVSKAFALGARDFIDKPCTRNAVLNAIRTANAKPREAPKENPWPNRVARV